MKKLLAILAVTMLVVSSCSTEEFEETTASTVKSMAVQTVIPTETLLPETVEETYIGNKKSRKFHKSDCNTLPSEKNRIYLGNRNEAVERVYSPCGNCNP